MSRRKALPLLPSIAVESQTHKHKLEVPEDLKQRLDEYERYFHAVSGRKPLTTNHVIVGILEAFLNGDAGFGRWRAEQHNGKPHNDSLLAAERQSARHN
jgi:hypothetical protein